MFKKMTAIYIAIMLMFSLLVLRLRFLSSDNGALSVSAQTQGRLTLSVGEGRGEIYDRYFRKLVNSDQKRVYAVNPTPKAIQTILEKIDPEEREDFLKRADSGRPFIFECDAAIEHEDIISIDTYERYSEDQPAAHIIGYINSDDNGVTGVEASYDNWLMKNDPQIKVSYQVNALGNALSGVKPTIDDSSNDSAKGVWLTIDKNIQQIVETAADKYLEKGAIVVMETNSGNIVASTSVPAYSPLNVSDSINDKDSPLLNRAFCAYNLGSLFKLVTSASALESGITENYQHNCIGSIDVGNQGFSCNNKNGHGTLDMSAALQKSCNPYFINLGQCIGGEAIYDMAVKLGFGSASYFADGLYTSKGNLPQKNTLQGAVTANFSFGQGELLATPIQVCAMVNAIASNGEYYAPMLINGTVDDDKNAAEKNVSEGVRVMSIDTAQTLQRMMREVLNEQGTGSKAYSEIVTSAGKTATAETGIIENGERVEHSWFGGFFPYLSPEYSVVVLAENSSDGRQTVQPAFKYISETISNEVGFY